MLPNLVHGPENVARAILGGMAKLAPPGLMARNAQINGEPGVVSYVNGRPFAVLTLEIAQERGLYRLSRRFGPLHRFVLFSKSGGVPISLVLRRGTYEQRHFCTFFAFSCSR